VGKKMCPKGVGARAVSSAKRPGSRALRVAVNEEAGIEAAGNVPEGGRLSRVGAERALVR
jgi:hypothetical protein